MARQFLTGIDLAKNELLNARAQNLASHPTSPLDGLFYYNSTDHRLYYYANGAWVDTSSNGGEVFTTAMMNKLNDATNTNTISTLVMRDASGNFSAGTITATLTGNASTATKLATSRTISVSGDGSGSASFDGTANATITLTLASVGTAGTYTKVTVDSKGRVTGSATLSASDIPTLTLSKISDAGTVANKNTGTTEGTIPILGVGGKLDTSVLPAIAITDTYPVASESAMLALSAQRGDVAIRSDNKTNYILATDDPTQLANWLALAVPTDVVTSVAGKQGAVTLVKADVGLGNVDNTADSAKNVLSATKLTTTRAIALSGDVTGTANFDGSAGISIASTLANSGVTAGTYKSVTVDAKGRVTAGTNPTTLNGYGITDAVKKYTTTVGDGSATSIVVTHNLNTRAVVVSLFESASPYNEVMTDVQLTSVNTLTLLFATAPTSGQYTITVMG